MEMKLMSNRFTRFTRSNHWMNLFCANIKLEKRFEKAPNLFQNQKWRDEDHSESRTWIFDRFEKITQQFPWNKDEAIKIIPLIHGTDYETALKICSTGFASLSVLDSGWYGQGVYFSSSAKYVIPYMLKPKPAIIISYVIPGNIFPVFEDPRIKDDTRIKDDPRIKEDPRQKKHSYSGKAIKPGYQSHYVVTKVNGYPAEKTSNHCFDELVVGQEDQIVPAFILKVDMSNASELIEKFNREVQETKRLESSSGIITPSKPSQKPIHINTDDDDNQYIEMV